MTQRVFFLLKFFQFSFQYICILSLIYQNPAKKELKEDLRYETV